MSDRTIQVTMTFKEADLNSILAYTFVGDNAPKVKDLTAQQFTELEGILQASAPAFVEEIVDGSSDDGDWMFAFMEQFE